MGLLNDVNEELARQEQAIAEILANAEKAKEDQGPRLGLKDLEEQTPGAAAAAQSPTFGHTERTPRAAGASAEREFAATGGEAGAQQAPTPNVVVLLAQGEQPAKFYGSAGGAIMFSVGNRLFTAPKGSYEQTQDQRGRPLIRIDATKPGNVLPQGSLQAS